MKQIKGLMENHTIEITDKEYQNLEQLLNNVSESIKDFSFGLSFDPDKNIVYLDLYTNTGNGLEKIEWPINLKSKLIVSKNTKVNLGE